MAKTRSKKGEWEGTWPPETDAEWEALHRLRLEQQLSGIEARAKSGLAWPKLDPRKHASLIAGWKGDIYTVDLCRRCIAEGRPWALAYHLLLLVPGETRYLAHAGEKAAVGAHAGGAAKHTRTADRDLQMATEYLALAGPTPKSGQIVKLKKKVGASRNMASSASVKAIDRGLARLLKK